MPTVKVAELFKRGFDEWHDIFVDFWNYKLCGEQPDHFGRDAPLDLPQCHHIHLATTDQIMQQTFTTLLTITG